MFPSIYDFPLPITTPRLILQQPVMSDDCIQQYRDAVAESIEELKKWLPWAKEVPSLSQIKEYIGECNNNWITKNNNDMGLPLWIFDKEKAKFIGNIVMWNIAWDIPKFELGYWARNSQTKNGYITEAVNALTRYCILQLGVKRIEIRCEIKNISAQMIPKRLGYELDGVLRNSTIAVSDGELTDTALFSRIDVKNLPDLDITCGNHD